jgi:integrase
MFTLAYRAGKIPNRPPFPSIEVRNTRSGFFEEAELREVMQFLPGYLRPFVECAYLTGWRRGELCSLTWRQVDFVASTVRLEPGTTKNDEGRTFPFAALPRLAELLVEQREMTAVLECRTGTMVPWVFHREGKQVNDYRDSWATACRKAGVPGRLVHDLRRTAVRNLERAGVPRSVAMKLTGHKTENIYRRYAIVSEADLTVGVQKLAVLHQAVGGGRRTVIPFPEPVAGRTDTVLAQFEGETTGRDPQPVAVGCEVWRPQAS